jgi:hypothetical protein
VSALDAPRASTCSCSRRKRLSRPSNNAAARRSSSVESAAEVRPATAANWASSAAAAPGGRHVFLFGGSSVRGEAHKSSRSVLLPATPVRTGVPTPDVQSPLGTGGCGLKHRAPPLVAPASALGRRNPHATGAREPCSPSMRRISCKWDSLMRAAAAESACFRAAAAAAAALRERGGGWGERRRSGSMKCKRWWTV